MKITVSVPDDLFLVAERLGRRLRISRSHLYSRALRTFVAKAEEQRVTALLNKVYDDEPSGLDVRLMALQSRSIPPELW